MRVFESLAELSLADRRAAQELARQTTDEPLSPTDAHLFFVGKNAKGARSLLGYCVYEWKSDTELYIRWLAAPRNGRRVLRKLLRHVKRNNRALDKVSLLVSIDQGESEKAAVARLNLYYGAGFKGVALRWKDGAAKLTMNLTVRDAFTSS